MAQSTKIRKRSEVPVEDTWALEDLFVNDAAWEKTLGELEQDTKELAAFSGHLSDSAEQLFAYLQLMEQVSGKCELLANYSLVERVRDMSEFRSVIAYGRESVSNAREAVRSAFSAHYGDIPDAFPQDMADAQLLYGLVMEELDADEDRLDSDDCALELLDTNRGRWHVVKGVVKWNDSGLERQFRLFSREPVPGKTRWERDFGRRPRVIESQPVQLKSE